MKSIKRIVSIGLILSSVCINPATVFASESTQVLAVDNTEFHDFLVSGLLAAEALSDLENTAQTEFTADDFADFYITDTWRTETESFLNDYLTSENSYSSTAARSNDVSLAEAKATSIAYAINCAEWSISQNRSNDLATESEYMFLSHYIDRKDYFWNQGNPALLLDGEKRSGPNGALAKWITDSDRQSYWAYMSSTKVSTSLQHIGNIALGYISVKGNDETLARAQNDFSLAGDVFSTAAAKLVMLDSALTAVDVYEDFRWLKFQIITSFSNDPDVRLDALFQRYMEDGSIFTDYTSAEKKDLIQNSIAVVSGYALGGCAGAAESALGTLKSAVIGLTIETYTDFFNYVAWLGLQNGYGGRYAMRFADYAGI